MKKVYIDEKTGRTKVVTVNLEPSKTQQQFKDEVEINNIVKKYKRTGTWHHQASKAGIYADVSQMTDYKESVDKVMKAQEAFSLLPSELRTRFANDPSQLLAFLQDQNNREEAEKLGLINKRDELNDAKPISPAPPTDNKNNDLKV